jgi:hypothetical protein
VISDLEIMLVEQASMDGAAAIDGFAQPASGGD